MSKFESVEVPFKMNGNRRCLTMQQLAADPGLADFVKTFRHCFEEDHLHQVMNFIEREDVKHV